jgi:hypothetical protein
MDNIHDPFHANGRSQIHARDMRATIGIGCTSGLAR